jgi:hypothetical protein
MTADRRTLGEHRRAKRQVTGTEFHVLHTAWPDALQTGINLLIYKNSFPTSQKTECFLRMTSSWILSRGEKISCSHYSDSLGSGRSGHRIPVGEGQIFRTRPCTHPASCTMGTDVDHPTHLEPRLKKDYGYTYSPPLGPSWPVLEWNSLCRHHQKCIKILCVVNGTRLTLNLAVRTVTTGI